MKSEREKMLAGELYNALDPELSALRRRARQLTHELNHSRDDEVERRETILKHLFGITDHLPWLEPPFYCDYGVNIRMGQRVFFNFNFVCSVIVRIFYIYHAFIMCPAFKSICTTCYKSSFTRP